MHNTAIVKYKGFTLIEVLLVIAMMAVLAAVVIFAINPSKHLSDSRDAQREADIYTLMQALYQYAADNEGDFPPDIRVEQTEVCITGAESCGGLINLSVLTNSQAYAVEMPIDPLCGSVPDPCAENGTGYFVSVTPAGRILLIASSSEQRLVRAEQ